MDSDEEIQQIKDTRRRIVMLAHTRNLHGVHRRHAFCEACAQMFELVNEAIPFPARAVRT